MVERSAVNRKVLWVRNPPSQFSMSRLYKGTNYKDSNSFYVHRMIAEKMLGRPLKNEECVHHIDCNKRNNSEKNLIIFVSRSAHSCYHHGGELIPTNEKYVFDCKPKINYCVDCGIQIQSNSAKRCVTCGNKHHRKVCRPDANTLVEEIKNSSFCAVGKKYGVSDNAVRKWIIQYGIDPSIFHKK